jgi:amino acid permease
LAKVGLGLGSFLIGLSGLASLFGLTLLSHCAARVGRQSSFFQVSKITYPAAGIYFDLAIAVKCFGVSISYLVIIRDLVT